MKQIIIGNSHNNLPTVFIQPTTNALSTAYITPYLTLGRLEMIEALLDSEQVADHLLIRFDLPLIIGMNGGL